MLSALSMNWRFMAVADWDRFTTAQLIEVNEMALRSKGKPKAERIEFDSRQEIFTRLDND